MRTLQTTTFLSRAFLASTLAASAQGQGFGGQQVITQAANQARFVYATDLDGDGDADVLSAQDWPSNKVAWYENLGGGSFGGQQVITQAAIGVRSVYAADLDGDGDADVLSASSGDDKIAWYENLGGGTFGSQQVITQAADWATSVYATDLDGDGDADVLSSSTYDDKIAWYENLGGGSFGNQQVITQAANEARSVYATDLDGDGDADVLSASEADDKIAWYENLGGGSFGGQQVITQAANGARCAYATDLDGDGAADVLSASGNKIAWHKNLGGGIFGGQQVITQAANLANSVYATDLDGDGDADVLSASGLDDKIAWYENLGGGVFGGQQVITQAANGAYSVYATDLDLDGKPDVLSASWADLKIAWYRNLSTIDCNGNGVADSVDIAFGLALDCNNNGVPDSCDLASGLALDCNNNGIPDSCDIAYDPTIDANLNSVPDSCEVAGSRYWTLSPVTGNWYTVTDQLEADDAAQVAVNLGGDLVTINSQAENDWLSDQFGDINNPFWIGLNDAAVEGQFVWLSGEPVTYTNWRAGQPDDAPGLFGADFAVLTPPLGTWNDEPDNASTYVSLPRGVVELVSSDCDGNGIPDAYELIQDPSLDWNGDGYLDTCANGSIVYCVSNPNAAGLRGLTQPQGSPIIADNNFTLRAHNLPIGQPGMFLMSRSTGLVNPFGGGAGVLCLGPPIRRFAPTDGFPLQFTSSSGELFLSPSIASFPDPVPVQPGEVIHFQLWHREFDPASGAPRSNTSEGISVMFR